MRAAGAEDSVDYYFADGDVQRGPCSLADLARRGVRPDTLVWREGMREWKPAKSVPELYALFAPPAPTATAPPPTAPPMAPLPYVPAAGATIGYAGYGMPGERSTGLAVTSMVLGIVSLPMTFAYCLGFPLAVLAVVFGHMARARIRRGEAAGDGQARAGLICGYIALALAAVGILFVVVVIGIAATTSGK